MKKFLCKLLIGTCMVSMLSSTSTFAANNNTADNVMLTIEENISFDKTGFSLDNEEIVKDIDEQTIQYLNEKLEEQGIDISYTKESLTDVYSEVINSINEQIELGNLIVLEDGSMINSNDDSFYLQGGSTYDKYYWWGIARYKSTKDANTWVYELNKAAAGNLTYSALLGLIFGGVGSLPNGLTAIYLSALANEVNYCNSKNESGIQCNINWALIYDVWNQ